VLDPAFTVLVLRVGLTVGFFAVVVLAIEKSPAFGGIAVRSEMAGFYKTPGKNAENQCFPHHMSLSSRLEEATFSGAVIGICGLI
jgi:hypothetical protein